MTWCTGAPTSLLGSRMCGSRGTPSGAAPLVGASWVGAGGLHPARFTAAAPEHPHRSGCRCGTRIPVDARCSQRGWGGGGQNPSSGKPPWSSGCHRRARRALAAGREVKADYNFSSPQKTRFPSARRVLNGNSKEKRPEAQTQPCSPLCPWGQGLRSPPEHPQNP